MSQTYKATGINLKAMPLGESDRLLTILTQEYGLIRVVAPGSRKPKSRLGGRSALFVVNELLLSKGRSLDKILQAETHESYPGLGKNLGRLTASQYLAELVLYQALSGQPQEGLFWLLCEHLTRLEKAAEATTILANLTHAIFHLLAWAGIAPQVQACCLTQQTLIPNFNDPDWRVGFSLTAGGTVELAPPQITSRIPTPIKPNPIVAEVRSNYSADESKYSQPLTKLTALELGLLQQLAQPEIFPSSTAAEQSSQDVVTSQLSYPTAVWLSIERVLRQYAQYHFDRPIRSAALIDTCFVPFPLYS